MPSIPISPKARFKGLLERMILPFFFSYNYLSPNAAISFKTTRLMIVGWILLDVTFQTLLDSWGLLYATVMVSTYIMAWKIPPLMGAAMVGVQLTRLILSVAIVLVLYSGVSQTTGTVLEWTLTVFQGWALLAGFWLLLTYLRTPKKDMRALVSTGG